MKKLILLLALAFVMCGCTSEIPEPQIKKDNITNINGWYCSIIEIDSCEYIQGGYMLSHKGNCKYCQKRLENTIDSIIKNNK